MASSTVVANLINREVENSDAWSLGCDITIEEMDVVVEEIKLNDIAIAGVIKTDDISVDIYHDKNNVMDLDVNVVIDGLNSSIVESQVVPYERIVETNELSPESSYEKGFAASAKSVKKVKDSVDSLDNTVKSNTSNIAKVATDIESLTRRVDRLSMSEGGEDLGGIWYIDELTGNLVTDKQVEIKSNLIVAGDTSTGRTGEDPGTTGIDEEQLQDYLDEHKYITSDYPYSKQEVDNKIEGIDVSGQINNALTDYAKTEDVNNALENKADKTELDKYLLKKAESQEIEGDITIKGNLIITGDTSTEGTGQDVPSGIDEAQLKEYLDTNKYITSDYAYSKEEVNRLIDEVNAGDIDLTNYYTKEETASEISNAIAGIEIPSLEGYAKLTDIPSLDGYATEQFVTDSITALNVGQYATKTALETLQGEVDNIESVLGMDEEAAGIINTWNEVKAFLAEIEVGDDLASILEGINTRIGNNTTAIGLIDGRVTVNEAAISDNATNIKNLKDSVYTKDDLATYKAWWDDVMSLVVKDGNNIKINTNLIVTGDTASGARGTDSGTDGTLIGVVVNGTRYEDETNGMLDLSTLMNQYALTTDIPSLDGYALKTEIPTTMAWTAITGKPSFASVATSGSYNDLSNKPTIPTTLPASDVYAWAKAATKPSYKTSEVAEETNLYFTNARAVSALADTLKSYVTKTALASDLGEYASKEWVNEKGYITGITLTGDDYISVNGYGLSLAIDAQGGLTNTGQGLGIYQIPSAKIVTDALGYTPLSTAGGTIEGGMGVLNIKRNVANFSSVSFENTSGLMGYIGFYRADKPAVRMSDNSSTYLLYHEGNFNPADYLPKSGGTVTGGSRDYTPLIVKNANLSEVWIAFQDSVGTALIGSSNGVPSVFLGSGSNQTLIHSGNIGSQSVASARFVTDTDNRKVIDYTDGHPLFGFAKAEAGYDSVICGNNIILSYGTGHTTGLVLNSSGNVTIGASDLAGTDYRLYVNTGKSLIYAWNNTAMSLGSAQPNSLLIGADVGLAMWYQSGVGSVLQSERFDGTATAYNLSLQPLGGNVLIGTTTDVSWAKLNVYGPIISKDYLSFYRNGTEYGYIGLATNSNNDIYLASIGKFIMNATNGTTISGAVTMSSTAKSNGYYLSNSEYAHCGLMPNATIAGGSGNAGDIWLYNTKALKLYADGGISMQGAVTMSSTLSVTSTITAGYHILASTGAKNNIGSNTTAFNDIYLNGGAFFGQAVAGIYIDQVGINWKNANAGWTNRLITMEENAMSLNVNTTIKGNLIVAGDTATGSDIRFKDKLSDHRIALSDIADAPLFTFRWNDREDDSVHLGSSAQYWEKVAPWLVKGEDFKTLDYSTLGVAIGISLANKAVNHEERIKILEKENKALKEQIRRIQYGN